MILLIMHLAYLDGIDHHAKDAHVMASADVAAKSHLHAPVEEGADAQQINAQNSPSQASTACEPLTSRCSSWIQKRQETMAQIANICWIIEKAGQFQKKHLLLLY